MRNIIIHLTYNYSSKGKEKYLATIHTNRKMTRNQKV